MGDYYLRIEAVNLNNFVYDTNDISTIRGGSFLLLDIVNRLESAHDLNGLLKKISTGASAGLFRIIGNDPDDVKKRVRDYLDKKTDGHATFVVDTLDGDNLDFKAVQEQLLAKNRWSQWQQLTIPWGKEGWKGSETPCFLDGIRPGLEYEEFPEKGARKISNSVKFRRYRGKELRNSIYTSILDNQGEPCKFTNDLECLSDDKDQGILNKKIAFIYIDGNKFGRIRDEKCTDEEKLQEFDKSIQIEFREAILKKLLSYMAGNDASLTADKKLRLETLLWGGDEIEWVVPAWKGWEVLRLFYEFDPPPAYHDEIPLTHASGIVFCHHNAPILKIRKLAHRLANLAKSNLTSIPKSHEHGDIFHYLILESFDMVEGNLDTFLKDYYKPVDYKELLLNGLEMQSFSKDMKIVRSGFPRGKVYEIISALKEKKDVDDIKERGIQSCSASRKEELRAAIESLLKGNINRWFLIADLWDFTKEV